MASRCPCGCGRKIAHSRKDAAAGLDRLDHALPVTREAVEVLRSAPEAPGIPPDFRKQSEFFLQSGEELRRNFLAHAHGSASPSATPDLVELRGRTNEWFGTATVLMRSASGLLASH